MSKVFTIPKNGITCNAVVVDGCVVLGGVLVDVHLGRVGELGKLVLWDMWKALGLKGLQIGHVLTCKFKSVNLPKRATTTTTWQALHWVWPYVLMAGSDWVLLLAKLQPRRPLCQAR